MGGGRLSRGVGEEVEVAQDVGESEWGLGVRNVGEGEWSLDVRNVGEGKWGLGVGGNVCECRGHLTGD